MRALSDWSHPPRRLRRPPVQLDNLALVPASEPASLSQWQERARRLSAVNTLAVVPCDNLHLRHVGQQIRSTLKQRGRRSLIAVTRSPRNLFHSGRRHLSPHDSCVPWHDIIVVITNWSDSWIL